jgi:diacylglycerol kinase family enzyme
MLVVPLGTANLMGRHLGLAWNEATLGREVAEVIGRGKVLQLDAARVRSTDYPEEAGAGLFGALPMKLGRRVIDRPKGTLEELLLLVAGVGLDAKVVHELARVRSGPISYASYALPAALALGRYRFPVVRVDVDGQRLWNGAGIVLVGNVKEYGTGFAVLPHARPDDGVLDVCVMPCGNPAELIQLFLLAAAGEHLESEGVLYVKGKRVRVEGEVPVELQVDGDAAGWTPVEIGLLERRVGFLVP